MSVNRLTVRKAATFGLLAAGIAFLIFTSQEWTAGQASAKPASRKGMPDLVFPKLEGGSWRLSDHRGEVVLVNFWATWCPPCRQETPGLVQLARQYSPKGVAVVGVSLDEGGAAPVRSFVREFHVPYTILIPPPDSPYVSTIESLPTSILIDRSGRVVKTYMGAVREATFARDIEQLLTENSVDPSKTTT